MRVIQVLCAAGPVDAVTNQALACRALFERWGWRGHDYAPVIAAGMPRQAMRHLHELRLGDDEVLVLHYSGYVRGLQTLLASGHRSLLISHNITPARYFWVQEPVEAVRCELALGQLAELAARVDALAGVSEYNAAELRALGGRQVRVIPVLFDRASLPPPGPPPQGPPTILFVGRLVPHKRQDLVIRAFARYRRLEPEARLVLVGTPLTPAYGQALATLAEELAPGAVAFEYGIGRDRLAEHYRSAHAFLCLSEHEGFCIPLLEAFHFRVPVIARDVGAGGEVVGEAGVLLGEAENLDTVAELLRIVAGDLELREELAARGERRLEVYEYERTASALREAVMSVEGAR
jgi:glycosyltransferase involved in cell wall biosynthesis